MNFVEGAVLESSDGVGFDQEKRVERGEEEGGGQGGGGDKVYGDGRGGTLAEQLARNREREEEEREERLRVQSKCVGGVVEREVSCCG